VINEETKEKESLTELLFELANPDRLSLLAQIAARKQRMSSLSGSIKASVPECSRHLSRLTDSGLVRKDASGLYEATPVGRTVLKLLPGLETIVQNKEYFASHDLSVLPEGFIERIGILSQAERLDHFSDVFDRIKTTISQAREYSALLVDKPILVGKGETPSLGSHDHFAKFIFGKTIGEDVLASVRAGFPRSELALAEEVRIALGVTERSAGIIFPSINGKLDFGNGFFGESPAFRAWCNDLFEFFWAKSKRIYSVTPFSSTRTR